MSFPLSGVQRGRTVLRTEGRRVGLLAISSALRSPASLHTSVQPHYTFKYGWFRNVPKAALTPSTFLQVLIEKKGPGIKSYVCIRQCCGSGVFIPGPGSRKRIFSFPDPGSKRFLISHPDPHKTWSWFFTYPGSRIQMSKKHGSPIRIRNTITRYR